ncbi:MAG: hypothetical protein Q7S83_03015 [bacterium]|nr:hypothetical protein [bacterium]
MDWSHDNKWYGPTKEGLKAAIVERNIIVAFPRLYGSTVYVRLKTLEPHDSRHHFNFTGETIDGKTVKGEIGYYPTEDDPSITMEVSRCKPKAVKAS